MITFAHQPAIPRPIAIPPHQPGDDPEKVKARRRRLVGLGDDIARHSANIEAARCQLLDMIRVFDESEGWYEEGFKSCAAWLSWRIGIAPGAARERVRVARALGDLPKLRAALGSGALSYSMARAITRVATPENEAELVEAARHTAAADMERLVSAWRVADGSEQDERARHDRRELWLTPDNDGSWSIRGRLDPEVGALLYQALEAAGQVLWAAETADLNARRANAEGDPTAEALANTPAEARRADALGLLAEAALGGGLDSEAGSASETGSESESESESDSEAGSNAVVSRANRFQVVVHVSAETLAANHPAEAQDVAQIEHGPHVSAETSRRLACDSGVVTMTHDSAGTVLDVGRRRRTVSTPLRRALVRRDRTCRFPGCLTRFCDAHHVKHWALGGETALDNLVLLCRHHHRRVHEDGWRVTLEKDGEARFYRPDGRPLPSAPPVPTLPNGPADGANEIAHGNRQLGLRIDSWTPTPRWMGEPLDVDWALFTLRRPAFEPGLENVSAETPRRDP